MGPAEKAKNNTKAHISSLKEGIIRHPWKKK
jgi:hypothetical protein